MLPKFQSTARGGDAAYIQRAQSKQGLTPLTPSGLFITTQNLDLNTLTPKQSICSEGAF